MFQTDFLFIFFTNLVKITFVIIDRILPNLGKLSLCIATQMYISE